MLSFWEVVESIFYYIAYASLTSSKTLLLQLLACLNFTLDSEDLFCWCKQKKPFLWTIVTAKAAENHGDEWGLTHDEGYINQLQPEPAHKNH